MKTLAMIAAIMATTMVVAVGQQPNIDPAKLAPLLQQQRDAANNQVAFMALQLQDALAEVQRLKDELAKRPQPAAEGAPK